MRFFIAINFSEEVKEVLFDVADELRHTSLRGNYTPKENYHLTVAFIGETDRLAELKSIVNSVKFEPFNLTLNKLGKFEHNRGDIYWVGLMYDLSLESIYTELVGKLNFAGFNIENRSYKPHITIARDVVNDYDYNIPFKQVSFTVTKLDLMLSERVNGVLTYSVIQ